MSESICLLIQGAAKQVILGVPIQQLYTALSGFSRSEHSVFSLWLMPLCAAMSLYFTLSGYCDMARGLGGMFGVALPRNFYYPYQSRSVTDFVGRFNISVTSYLKTYIYHPLGEDSGGFASAALNIGLVTLLWGLWFGFRINYLLWGLYFVLLILLERSVWGRILVKLPVFLLRVYTFSLVLFSFVIFNGRSVGKACFSFWECLAWAALRPLLPRCCIWPANTPLISFWPFCSAPACPIRSRAPCGENPRRRPPWPEPFATVPC